ncbi:MAG: hypothetical protein GC191_17005 [Azospirillum sp.]|nr:hypothetical protein [Azospirillum sp.]
MSRQGIPLSTAGSGRRLGAVRRRLIGARLGLVLLAINLLSAALVPPIVAAHGLVPRFVAELAGYQSDPCIKGAPPVADRRNPAPAGHDRHDGFCVFCLPLMNPGSGAPAADSPAPMVWPVEFAPFRVPAEAGASHRPARLVGAGAPRAPPAA